MFVYEVCMCVCTDIHTYIHMYIHEGILRSQSIHGELFLIITCVNFVRPYFKIKIAIPVGNLAIHLGAVETDNE